MHIRSLLVENFRAIRRVELTNLGSAVVVAGSNGCGKSSLFDAVRLLKSAYGQYHQHEYQSWFNEFQINFQRIRSEAHRVLNDLTRPMRIRAELELSPSERDYLRSNARQLYLQLNWAQLTGVRSAEGEHIAVNPAVQRAQGPIVESQTNELMTAFESAIEQATYWGELTMTNGNDPVVTASPVLELMFSVYKPQHLGIIDYHGPHRSYGREQVESVSFHIAGASHQQSQHALYNTHNKYNGVKTEMAQSYVRHLIARDAGVSLAEDGDLKHTLDELFSVFFPGKQFLGARPTGDGGLSFPVKLESGHEHDINELSSGEKEVLLGYLRLRNSAPRNSIVLLDEPELHLNPRLTRGLPRFYQKHLGEALGNQLWLITHSDALLREAVNEPAYTVFHMQPSYAADPTNQVVPVSASAAVERAVIALVGDLATYSPRSKVVLLEGEDSEFDASMIQQLFPEFADRVNLVSAGPKGVVAGTQRVLERAAGGGKLDARFYAIVDRDLDVSDLVESGRQFAWNVYHIENYLLEPAHICASLRSLQVGGKVLTDREVADGLLDCARDSVDELVEIQLRKAVNGSLVNCLSTKFAPGVPLARGFRDAADRSKDRLTRVLNAELTLGSIEAMETRIRADLLASFSDGSWRSKIRGRDVLRRFADRRYVTPPVKYEVLRNLIINRMRESGFRPPGMSHVVDRILSS